MDDDPANDDVEVLQGGVGNAGAVLRVGAHVLRPTNPHSQTIHALIDHVRASGFTGVPDVVGVDADGRERLVFIEGDVPIPPFPAWSSTDAVLASTAALLRRFHDATASFRPARDASWSDEMADPRGGTVICHNDVCPENVVYRDGRAVALLDLDFAAPGRRTYDVASLARMCVPIDHPDDAARTGRGGLDPVRRLRVVADGYGFDLDERTELLELLDDQVARSGEFVQRRVDAGEPAFIEMWEASGGMERFDRRRRWWATNHTAFVDALA